MYSSYATDPRVAAGKVGQCVCRVQEKRIDVLEEGSGVFCFRLFRILQTY